EELSLDATLPLLDAADVRKEVFEKVDSNIKHRKEPEPEELPLDATLPLLDSDVRKDLFEKINSNIKNRTRGPTIWEFLVRIINNPATYPTLVCWEDRATYTLRLKKPNYLARVWKSRGLSNKKVSYSNFARALRYWYKRGGLQLVEERQLLYRLGPLARAYLAKLQEDTSVSTASS
ncbi:unnamed protein product, partial [Meganyctiphanes norvegica]